MDDPKVNQDTSQKEDSSEKAEGTSTEPQTYTKDSEKKAIDDALSAAGRDAKSISDKIKEAEKILDDAKKARDSVQGERAKWQKDRDETDLEAARDDPNAIKSIRARQKDDERESELSKKEQELSDSKKEHQDALDELVTSKQERNALEIALKHGVPFEKLLKFTDGSTEQMEELAQSLPKKEGQEVPLRPDSNAGPGGGGLSEEDKLKARYPTMK